MTIRQASTGDITAVTALALRLWPSHGAKEMAADLTGFAEGGGLLLLAEDGGAAIGFAQCGLRHDYVEGTHSSPVGYLEGIYVLPDCRQGGVARALVGACEAWACQQGCRQFASDCTLDNAQSAAFHRAVGFAEAARIICFTKEILP